MPPEVIDLCSEDSVIISAVSSKEQGDAGIPFSWGSQPAKANTESWPTRVAATTTLSDIELELDDLVPTRPAKRKCVDTEPKGQEHNLDVARGPSSRKFQRKSWLDFDPIFSSSPPPVLDAGRKDGITSGKPSIDDVENKSPDKVSLEWSPVDSEESDCLGEVEGPRSTSGLSQSTATLLAEISVNSNRKSKFKGLDSTAATSSTATRSKPKPNTATHTEEQLARKAAKEAAKAEAAAQRRFERERKAMAKELASNHAEANKARWDKKVATPEMIVDIPEALQDGHMATELRRILDELQVEYTMHTGAWIKWRRKSTTIFNRELHQWELRPLTIVNEPQMLCITTAQEFVQSVQSAEGRGQLARTLQKMSAESPGCQTLYIIEGLEAYLKKQRNLKNRSYQASVRQEPVRGKAPAGPAIDEDQIEEALIELPLQHGCFIFHTINALETAEWIGEFTQHISTVPYRHERNNLDSQFCMDNGQVKAGEDAHDVFVRALQQVVRVTAPIAYGIAAVYPDVPSLIAAFEAKGDLALENIQKCVNRDGTASSARIGPQISRRLARVFMSTDPDSVDI